MSLCGGCVSVSCECSCVWCCVLRLCVSCVFKLHLEVFKFQDALVFLGNVLGPKGGRWGSQHLNIQTLWALLFGQILQVHINAKKKQKVSKKTTNNMCFVLFRGGCGDHGAFGSLVLHKIEARDLRERNLRGERTVLVK